MQNKVVVETLHIDLRPSRFEPPQASQDRRTKSLMPAQTDGMGGGCLWTPLYPLIRSN